MIGTACFDCVLGSLYHFSLFVIILFQIDFFFDNISIYSSQIPEYSLWFPIHNKIVKNICRTIYVRNLFLKRLQKTSHCFLMNFYLPYRILTDHLIEVFKLISEHVMCIIQYAFYVHCSDAIILWVYRMYRIYHPPACAIYPHRYSYNTSNWLWGSSLTSLRPWVIVQNWWLSNSYFSQWKTKKASTLFLHHKDQTILN